jgi:hypothetical protein
MIYYRVNEDWITYLEGPLRAGLLATLRGLKLERLQKYPPPKLGGLPFGNEARIMERFFRGESSQLDASALHKFYISFADERDELLYRAFRRNSPLSRAEWAEIIGEENIDKWAENTFLRADGDGHFVCRFSIVVLDGLLCLVDPMNDHGNGFESVALPKGFTPGERDENDDNIQQFNHTYIGMDSLRQIEWMSRERIRKGNRYLDCGPGAGALLLYFARKSREAVGIDLNPRAVTLSGFNAELNGLDQCRLYFDNAITSAGKYGKFDLVSWNLPFIFMPAEYADEVMDAYGGELGIGLCLEFIEAVPELLTEKGFAYIAALSPILKTGENVLETKLKEKLGRLGLDCRLMVAQVSLANTKELWDFHQSHNIAKFESVYLHLKHGTGNFERVEPPVTRKVIDAVREKMYQRKFG